MRKVILTISACFISYNVFAANVIPQCNDISSSTPATINNAYKNSSEIFYTFGMDHKFFLLNKGECITNKYSTNYTTTLSLNSDGNLINYLYSTQDDITYVTFSSDTINNGVNQSAFYLDSNNGFKLGLELLGTNNSVIKNITPLATNSYDQQLSGSLVLGSISNKQNAIPNWLSTYDAATGRLFQYTYNYHPVSYIELFFDNHTIETRDAEYKIKILDYTNNQNTPQKFSCSLPFKESSCNGKVKYIAPNHYLIYLTSNVNIELAKIYTNNDQNTRKIYFDGQNNIYFGWNNTYNISLASDTPQLVASTYEWTPYTQKSYSSLHLLSWNDKQSVPNGSYQDTCNMSNMTFNSGILSGSCSYVDNLGILHWETSSLNYDEFCKNDLGENDQVVNNNGQLACQ